MASRARAALSTQPTYDFLAGSPDKENMPLRQTFRTSSASMATTKAPFKPTFDQENEDLRAEIKKLQYELEAIKSDGQLGVVALERERAQLLAKIEIEGKKAGDLSRKVDTLNGKMASMVEELKDERRARSDEKRAFDAKARDALDLKASAEEEIEEARAELESQKRQSSFQLKELSEKLGTYRVEAESLALQMDEQTALLREAETRGLKYQAEATRFEKEILTLRGQVSSDPAEVETLRNELNIQVEKTNTAEMARLRLEDDLTRLQAQFKSVGIVEEEKRALEVKLRGMESIERERDEAVRQKSILQDEKRTWSELLRMNGGAADSSDSPEAICRELASTRLEIVHLKSQIGQLSSELQESEGTKWRAEEEVARLRNEMQALQLSKSAGVVPLVQTKVPAGSDNKLIARLERQKNLQLKEIDYLKAQLKTFDAEEDLTGAVDENSAGAEDPTKLRISELESMVEQYRTELNDAVQSLRKAEVETPHTPPKTLKRALDEDTSGPSPSSTARIGELLRKTRSLQDELATATNETKILRVELSTTKEQLADLQAQTKTRVLSLRDNPVDDFENWKFSTIKKLRTENTDLLERIASSTTLTSSKSASVPASSLVTAQDRIEELEEELSSRDKRIMRLKQVFGEKTNELRIAIANLLGWNIELLPNNRFSLKSIVYTPAKSSGRKSQRIESPAIIFTGAASGTGTATAAPEMRIADDTFRKEIDGLTKYWIKGRGEIRGLLSAVTLEMLERGREGMTMGIVEAS